MTTKQCGVVVGLTRPLSSANKVYDKIKLYCLAFKLRQSVYKNQNELLLKLRPSQKKSQLTEKRVCIFAIRKCSIIIEMKKKFFVARSLF